MKVTVNSFLLATALASVCASPPSGAAAAAEPSTRNSSIEQEADSLRGDYRQNQWQRLSGKQDRESLIAAVLLGMPNETNPEPIAGNDAVRQRLAEKYGSNPDAMFALALSCQLEKGTCAHPEYYQALVKLAPDNAVNWLLLPNDAAPDATQLHSAAMAAQVNTQARMIVRIVRAALVDQPAPASSAGIDAGQLALMLRRHAVDHVMLPVFRPVVVMCKSPAEQIRTDCLALGRKLEADQSGSILARMIGSAMVRRLVKGTSEEADAKQLRREYAWMSEQEEWLGSDEEADSSAHEEQLQIDCVDVGEWSAWQRAMERAGKSATPPVDWLPRNPQFLLLSEERTPVPAK